MSNLRFNAVEKASGRMPVEPVVPDKKTSEYFGVDVFNKDAMQKYLAKETFHKITSAIDKGMPIDRGLAEHVAAGLRMWAMGKGATHYTHWFELPKSTTPLWNWTGRED